MFYKHLRTDLDGGRTLSFGRGRGVSFRAGPESVSHFKADITIAFLSLFPRSRITLKTKDVGHLLTNIVVVVMNIGCVNVLLPT